MAGERATKMLIISSARTLFSENGYDNTPVEEICTLAGIAKGTFFYYFESKQSIVRYILAMQLKEYAQRLKEQMDTLKDAISKAEYFVAALVEHGKGVAECDLYFKESQSEWYTTVLHEERNNVMLPLLLDVINQGVYEGYFNVHYPDVVAQVAFSGIDSYLHVSKQCGEEERKGIREITAKTLGLRESDLVI